MATLFSELVRAQEPASKRLFIMLHGLGDSIEGYRWFPEALNLPWLNYLLINAPGEELFWRGLVQMAATGAFASLPWLRALAAPFGWAVATTGYERCARCSGGATLTHIQVILVRCRC